MIDWILFGLFVGILSVLFWRLGILSSRVTDYTKEIDNLDSTILLRDIQIEQLLKEVKKQNHEQDPKRLRKVKPLRNGLHF